MVDKTKAEELEYEKLKAAYAAVLRTTAGKTVLWDILSVCGVYTYSAADTVRMAHSEGRRSVGLHVIQQLSATDESAYPRLMLSMAERGNNGK